MDDRHFSLLTSYPGFKIGADFSNETMQGDMAKFGISHPSLHVLAYIEKNLPQSYQQIVHVD